MSKSLDALLSTARARIAGADRKFSAGQNEGSPVPGSTGTKPGVDYAPKAPDDQKFVGLHATIKQEYPYGNEALFTGDKVAYSMNTPQMKHFGNTIDKAIAANEEVEQVDEVWKATQNEKGEHILKHKSGKISNKTYPSKGEAIDAAVRRNKASGAFKTEETIDEVSRDTLSRYVNKAQGEHKQTGKRREGIELALKKKWGNEKFGLKEPKVKASESVDEDANPNVQPIQTSKPAKSAECTCPAKECPVHTKKLKEDSNPNVQPIQTSKPAKEVPAPVLGSNNKDLKNKGKTVTVSNAAVGEEVIDELSKGTLNSYRQKAHDEIKGKPTSTHKAVMRDKGRVRATLKLSDRARVNASEETDIQEKNWIAGAIKHPGAEKRAASKAGESTHEYEEKHKNAPGKAGKRARLGLELSKFNKEETELDEGYAKTGYMCRAHANYHDDMASMHHDKARAFSATKNSEVSTHHSIAADNHSEAASSFRRAADHFGIGRVSTANKHMAHAKSWASDAKSVESEHNLAVPEHMTEEIDALYEGGILCHKDSLKKKMKYHKGKMKAEDIGSTKFKHHQKQIHVIKGMLEEAGIQLDETDKKDDDQYEYKKDKNGFIKKVRKYEGKERELKKEEVESIEELSRKTLGSYVKNAAGDIAHQRQRMSGSQLSGNQKNYDDAKRKTINRIKGVEKAADKLAKEEVESLEELSRKTLKSYVKKATTSMDRHDRKGEKEEDKSMSTDGNKYPEKQERHQKNATAHYTKSFQRRKGIEKATQKLKEEGVDPTVARIVAFINKETF